MSVSPARDSAAAALYATNQGEDMPFNTQGQQARVGGSALWRSEQRKLCRGRVGWCGVEGLGGWVCGWGAAGGGRWWGWGGRVGFWGLRFFVARFLSFLFLQPN